MNVPFFIVGFQRSGTTLIRLMLDNHPGVAIPLDVTGLWFRYEGRLGQYNDLAARDDVRRLVVDLIAEERIRLWGVPLDPDHILARADGTAYPKIIDAFYRAYAEAKGKARWGDKDPGNMTRIDVLHRWFPGSKIVHIIRDGRDACLSQIEQAFGYDDLLACACGWREEVQWVRRMGTLLGPERYVELRYEDLVSDPECELRKVCAFLDLEFDERMLRYHENIEASIPASKRHIWPKIGQPPLPSNAYRWRSRMPTSTQIGFEKRAGAVLRELGYVVSPGSRSGGYAAEIGSIARKAWRTLGNRLATARRPTAPGSSSYGGAR